MARAASAAASPLTAARPAATAYARASPRRALMESMARPAVSGFCPYRRMGAASPRPRCPSSSASRTTFVRVADPPRAMRKTWRSLRSRVRWRMVGAGMDDVIISGGDPFDPARRVFDHRGMTSVLVLAAWAALQAAPAPAPAPATPAVTARVVQREAVVIAPVENMYSGPDSAKDVVSQALLGQVVRILEEKDGIAGIETPDRYPGWIPSASLFPYPDPAAPRYAQRGTVAEVTAVMANLYRDPSVTTARPKAQAPLGTRLEVNAAVVIPEPAAARWIAVRLPSGE